MTEHSTAHDDLTHIYYLTVLEVRNLKCVSVAKIKVLAGLFFLKALGETKFPCLFQLLEAAFIPWLSAPSVFKASNDCFSYRHL